MLLSSYQSKKVFCSLFFQMKTIIYSLFNYPHFVITGPKNLAPASKLQLQSPQPPRVLVLHDLFWSGDNIFWSYDRVFKYHVENGRSEKLSLTSEFRRYLKFSICLLNERWREETAKKMLKLIVLTVYKRFLEAHKFCLCHNLLNSQWRSFIENVGLARSSVRSDSSQCII